MSDDPPMDGDADLSLLVGIAGEQIRRQRFDEAIALCRGVLARDHRHAAARHLLAIALIRTGEAGEACELMGPLTEEEPERLDYRLDLARAVLACGRHDEAIVQLEGLTERAPASDETWLALAMAYLAKTVASGDIPSYRSCSTAYRRAYAVSERKRDLMVTMAERFVEAGYYGEAEEALAYALLHAPGDRQVMAFMARIAHWKDHHRRAGSIW